MRTTFQDQIKEAAEQRQQAHREEHYQWMLTHARLFTHAVTLTFDPKKIDAYTGAFSRSLTRNHSEMVERYQDSMRLFANVLDRSLFGNMRERSGSPLLFVPVLEGLNNGQNPHFHCSVGIPESRFAAFEMKVKDAWQRVPFSGFSVKVVPYRDEGWLNYSTKTSKFLTRESIDWMNVRVPRNPIQNVEIGVFPSYEEVPAVPRWTKRQQSELDAAVARGEWKPLQMDHQAWAVRFAQIHKEEESRRERDLRRREQMIRDRRPVTGRSE